MSKQTYPRQSYSTPAAPLRSVGRVFEVVLHGHASRPDVKLPRLRPEGELADLRQSAEKNGYKVKVTHVEQV